MTFFPESDAERVDARLARERNHDKLQALYEAVKPLVDQWRDEPFYDDDVWRDRNRVVVAFDAVRK